MSFPHTNPDAIIDALARGESPLTWASSLLYSALDHSTPEDTQRSLIDCHVKGLDSIVLWSGGEGGGMIRFYVSYAGLSPLHNLYTDEGNFTVGVHNHRYRIAKIPLTAALVNVRTRVLGGEDAFKPGLYEYEFQSGIGGTMNVRYRRKASTAPLQPDLLMPGDVTIMEPEELHTVVTPRTVDSAWLVVEGTNVPNFQPLLYSPRPGLTLSDEGLYTQADHSYTLSSIRYAIDLLENKR